MPSPVIDTHKVAAVLFDMDGVITDTAKVHKAAWAQLFDAALVELNPNRPAAGFSGEDYVRLVDGRARIDGVLAVLADRGIELPLGVIDDAPGLESSWALANRKNEYFQALIAKNGVETFPSSVKLLDSIRDAGIPTAVVTASRNRADILSSAGLSDAFDVAVDGIDIETHGLAGKPSPATFLAAAERLEVKPARAVVVEDAVAGVMAGIAGGFGLVIGVSRQGEPEQLKLAGAHVVVDDLGQVKVIRSQN